MIDVHPYPAEDYVHANMVFMGYCEYRGWYPNPKYYNSQFAFPYTMVRAQ